CAAATCSSGRNASAASATNSSGRATTSMPIAPSTGLVPLGGPEEDLADADLDVGARLHLRSRLRQLPAHAVRRGLGRCHPLAAIVDRLHVEAQLAGLAARDRQPLPFPVGDDQRRRAVGYGYGHGCGCGG